MSRPILSTHVLDIARGAPAAGMFVELHRLRGAEDSWAQWHCDVTTGDGRVHFPFSKEAVVEGTYKLKFNVGQYYERTGKDTLYQHVEVVFKVQPNQHYHIPLLLSPYGYTTYRGS